MIQRRTILLATGTVIVAGCSSSMGGTSDPAAKRREIDASVDNALAQLYGKAAGSRELADKARGLLAGADSKAMYMLFMTDAALQKFESSNGWTAGADAQVTVINAGANASVDTATAQQPIIGYVLSNAGLMANLSLDGTKFSKIDL